MFGRLRHWSSERLNRTRRDRQLEHFIELLRKSEICTEKQVTDLVSSFGYERGEITSGDDGVSQFCRFLIVKNAVTAWQCDKLKAGKFRGFYLDDYLLLEVVGQDNTSRSYRARDMRDGSIVRLIVTPMNRSKDRHIEYRVERNFE